MAWVTAGTAKNARMALDPSKIADTYAHIQPVARWRGNGYTLSLSDSGEWYIDGFLRSVSPSANLAMITTYDESEMWWLEPIIIEHRDSNINISNGYVQVTNSAKLTGGIWEYDNTYVDLVSFQNLDGGGDPPATNANALFAFAGL